MTPSAAGGASVAQRREAVDGTFVPRMIMARRVVLTSAPMIEFPPYRMDPRAERLWRGTQPVPLRPKAWTLLHYLAQRPGLLVTKEEAEKRRFDRVLMANRTARLLSFPPSQDVIDLGSLGPDPERRLAPFKEEVGKVRAA